MQTAKRLLSASCRHKVGSSKEVVRMTTDAQWASMGKKASFFGWFRHLLKTQDPTPAIGVSGAHILAELVWLVEFKGEPFPNTGKKGTTGQLG